MDRSVFKKHFIEAAAAARDFARRFIEEPLPDAMRFRVHLNSSYDGTASPDFKLFPEDSSDERAFATKDLDTEGVIDILWREGCVPQWVDVQVVGEDARHTVLDVTACGRFIENEQRLYYAHTGIAPFSPKGPYLPLRYVEGDRFSIYYQPSCWSLEDLDRVERNAAKVWSLQLHGPAFRDTALSNRSTFPKLEILELYAVSLTGAGLSALTRFPRLRHFRARFGGVDELSLANLPVIESLETVSMTFLPSRLSHAATLVKAGPNLRELTLGSRVRTMSTESVAFDKLERLTLEFPRVPSWVRMPKSLRSLSLHAKETTDAEVTSALSACPDDLEDVGLRGTPVSDAILDELARHPAFKYLDAVDTRITMTALERLASRIPGFKCFPRLGSDLALVPQFEFERGAGSIFDVDARALVNPVNCVGVMGKGLARAFKEKFPDVFLEYERACRAEEIAPGRVQVVETCAESSAKYVINFPTKRHWRDKSRLEDIRAGLVDLAAWMTKNQISSIAIPALGCGLGGLDWKDVRRVIEDTLIDHVDVTGRIRVVLFEPQ